MVRTNDHDHEDGPPNELPTRPDHVPVRPPPPHRARVVCPSVRGPHSSAPLPGPAPRTTPRPNPLAALVRKPTLRGLADPFPAVDAPVPSAPMFPPEEAPTPTYLNTAEQAEEAREAARLVRNWKACAPDRRKQISRMALQYREDAEGRDR